MSNEQQHKPGVNENSLMVRNLKLEGDVRDNQQMIVEEIEQLLGVDAVAIDASENLLKVAYDATKRQLDEIEEIVRKYECDIADDWWTHIKEGYYKFVDQNVKDNANHEAWSCHKRPSGK
ncbi:cation transporter [uncultured Pseudoteredinibacter sp.]|uniref:cation transporter n=1 Tax=uncultured Pseudoteredinibacter sp. TaxID=1641701 RepID=UPI00260675EC|nr:cation transporter [uncultured Pseudoteredinibacter sp.]